MPFELPDNLHPDCGPIAWMLGKWGGQGHGAYPTIESFQFEQELIFTHDGRPFFHYFARAWIIDDEGQKVRDAALETGFVRCKPGAQLGESQIEFLLTHNTGFAEVYYGTAGEAKLEIATDAIARTATAKDYAAGKRLYGYVEGDLLYAYDMAAMGQALQPHTWARLQRQ
jgi:hypothetical protein